MIWYAVPDTSYCFNHGIVLKSYILSEHVCLVLCCLCLLFNILKFFPICIRYGALQVKLRRK